MSTLRILKRLLLGETWLLPLGVGAVLLGCALVLRPLARHAWAHAGGLVLLAGVVGVLIASAAHSIRRG